VSRDRARNGRGELRLVRPYALTKGRTRPVGFDLPIETLVTSSDKGKASDNLRLEWRQIVQLCITPMSVAEISAHLRVPLGVARVLVGDLLADGLVNVHRPVHDAGRPSPTVLKKVLHGLQRL
jgi:hypothetical protein